MGAHSSTPKTARDEQYGILTDKGGVAEQEWIDKLAAAFSIEQRQPYLDRRLVSFMLALPTQQKVRHGQLRFVARQALAEYLPATVLNRTGKGRMNDNFVRSLKLFDRGYLDDLLFGDLSIAEPYLNIDLLRRIYRYFSTHEFTGMDGASEALIIWEAVTLVKWLQTLQQPSLEIQTRREEVVTTG